jgi:hypothetical protein
MNKAYKAELLQLACYASVCNHPITIKSSPATADTVNALIRSNAITGCTIDGMSYDFNCTGGIWDKSDFGFLNSRLESITRD